MAIRVQFLADVVDYLRGSGKVKDATQDNAEGLEDLMRKAIRLGREIGKTTDEIALDLSRGFDVPLARAKRAVEEVGDEAETTGDKVDKSLSDGSARAGDSVSELGSIARDVLAGDFGSATESAASALMGLAGIVGGGAVGGAIATALGGIVGSFIQEWNRAAEETEQRISAMYQDMTDSGNRYLSQAYLIAAANDLIGDDTQRAKAERLAEVVGVDVNVAIGAMIGSSEDLSLVQGLLGERIDEVSGKVQAFSSTQSQATGETQKQFAELQNLRGELNGVGDALDSAGSKANAISGYQIHLLDTEAAAGRATKAIDEFGDAIYTMPDGKQVYVDAETGKATEDLKAIEDKQFAPKTAVVKMVVDDTDVRAWQSPLKVGYVNYKAAQAEYTEQLLGGRSYRQ